MRGHSHLFSLIFFFESMYSHVYGVKWSPWSVPFEINYLRDGDTSSQISLIFRIKFHLISLKLMLKT